METLMAEHLVLKMAAHSVEMSVAARDVMKAVMKAGMKVKRWVQRKAERMVLD
jgi:hypothetical protein